MTLHTLEASPECFLAMRRDGSTAAVFADPRPCPLCGKLHCFFVNRFGSTCCISCDHERHDVARGFPEASGPAGGGVKPPLRPPEAA